MNARLVINIDSSGELAWHAGGASGHGAPPETVRAAAEEIVALVPGEDVLLTRVALPPGNQARLATVLPFALEDRLLDDVDALHCVAGPRGEDGEHDAAVVARTRMQAWCDLLADAGLLADVMLPDTLAVPWREEMVVARLDGGRCLLRSGPGTGFACPVAELATWLAPDTPLRLLVPTGSTVPEVPDSRPWTLQALTDEAATLDEALATSGGLNLLSADFAPRDRHRGERRLWRAAAGLAVLALVLGLVVQVTAVLRLQSALAQAEDAVHENYAAMFPDQGYVPNPVARVRSELARLGQPLDGQGSGLLPLLGQIAPVLGRQGRDLQLQSLEYRNAALELAVRADDLGGLDGLREQLAALPGLNAELTSATPGDRGIEGRISITVSKS